MSTAEAETAVAQEYSISDDQHQPLIWKSDEWIGLYHSIFERINHLVSKKKIYDIFLEDPTLPTELRAALKTLRALNMFDGLESNQHAAMEQLLQRGKDAPIAQYLQRFWSALAQGDDDPPMYLFERNSISVELQSQINERRGNPTPIPLEQVITDMAKLSNLRGEVNDLLSLLDDIQHIRYSKNIPEGVDALEWHLKKQVARLQEIDPKAGRRGWEFWFPEEGVPLEKELLRLLELSNEYNPEWALAAFKLHEGRALPLIPDIQRLVAATPWSRDAAAVE